jgi:hypothetical protein
MKKSELRQLIREEIQNLTTLNFITTDEDGDKQLDVEQMEEVLKQNYESFESSMDLDEFEEYLDQYLTDVSNDVGPDEDAYGSISLSDFLKDFKVYVSFN